MMISRGQIETLLRIRSQKVQSDKHAGKDPDVTVRRGTDALSISPRAQEIQKLIEVIRSLPDERAERVEALAKAVADGTYKVDAREIAEKILGRTLADRLK